jgi:hypothetical protein
VLIPLYPSVVDLKLAKQFGDAADSRHGAAFPPFSKQQSRGAVCEVLSLRRFHGLTLTYM